MSSSRHNTRPAVIVPTLALCLGLLSACGGGGGGNVILPEGCQASVADLQGTWLISHDVASLSCPAGSTLQTTSRASSFTPVTIVRNESPPGFRITAPGLTATVDDVTCHIVWTYLDQDTNALFDCYTTFHPPSRTAGGTEEAGHCSTVILNAGAGASCTIPSPYLDTYIVVQGS